MPNIVTRQLTYTSELTGAVSDIAFKIRADKAGGLPVLIYDTPTANVCGGAAAFKPRALITQYSDGSTIRYPVPTQADIRGILTFLATDPTVVCVHLDGEKWNVVPGVGSDTSYSIPSGFGDKLSGVMTYASDVALGNINVRVAIERAPTPLAAAAIGCAEAIKAIDENGICAATLDGFKPRHFTMTAKNLTTQGKFARKAPLATPTEIIACRDAVSGVAPCISYKGESIRNAHLYV